MLGVICCELSSLSAVSDGDGDIVSERLFVSSVPLRIRDLLVELLRSLLRRPQASMKIASGPLDSNCLIWSFYPT